MDYCATQTGGAACVVDKGFINATTSGLAFFSGGTRNGIPELTELQLNATSSAAGSGVMQATNSRTGTQVTTTFAFAFNAGNFVRTDGVAPQCFDRLATNAEESVWRYGLYDATTGAQITRKSGFPIEYTAAGVTSNGYVGYNGMWMPVAVPNGATVNQITYTNPPTKTPYTLLQTGGKLMKYTTATKTLAALNKITFWYFAQASMPTTAPMTANSQYELYWDDALKQFFVSGQQNPNTGNMEPITPVVPVANADMAAANPWGLFGWSEMMGGQFGIKGPDFILLATNLSTTPVLTQMQDIVYPSQFAVIGGLTCINDCPTAALISASNAAVPPAQITPFINQGWTAVSQASFVPYTLDPATGNLIDAALAPVVSAVITGNNANGVRGGRMVNTTDLATIIRTKVCGANGCSYTQQDVDLLPAGSSYYVWETGGQP